MEGVHCVRGWARVCNGRRAHGLHQCLLAPELEDKWPPLIHNDLSSSSPSAPRLRVLFLVLYLNALSYSLASTPPSLSGIFFILLWSSYPELLFFLQNPLQISLSVNSSLATPDKQADLFLVHTQLPAVKSSITLIIFTLNHLLYIPPSANWNFSRWKLLIHHHRFNTQNIIGL